MDTIPEFRSAVRRKDFVISAELFLRPETSTAMLREQVRLLRDHVDGLLLTDNQGGKLHMSPLAAAALVRANGADPILQLSARNRNRIALLADLLGAAALGITSLMLIRGNRIPDGFDPRPKAVHDIDAVGLIAMATNLNDDDTLPSPPGFYVGGAVTAHTPQPGWVPDKLTRKADVGVQFVLTHLCMDPPLLAGYMKHLVAAGLTRRLSVFATLAVLGSAEDARVLRDSVPNYHIPDALIDRLAGSDDPEREGIRICAEQLRALREIPGIRGANLIGTRHLASIVAAIEEAR